MARELAGYSDRVQALVTRTIDANKAISFKSTDDLKKYIRNQVDREPEGRLGSGNAARDMVADITKGLRGRLRLTLNRREPVMNMDFIKKLSYVVQDSLGVSFPDGDPLDYIQPKADKLAAVMGVDIDVYDGGLGPYLDKAVKMLSPKYRNYNDWLKRSWDDIASDLDPTSAARLGVSKANNPW